MSYLVEEKLVGIHLNIKDVSSEKSLINQELKR